MYEERKISKAIEEWNGHFPDKSGKSGFCDLPDWETCTHPSHEVPGHMVIPEGKGYRHVCPGCGKVTILRGSGVRW